MRPTRVTTETDIPTVFHVEFVEVAEAIATVEVGEGVAVGFQIIVSDEVGCTDDENARAPSDVDKIVTGSTDEDEVWVREGEVVKAGETADEVEEVLVVGPRSGNRAPVDEVES